MRKLFLTSSLVDTKHLVEDFLQKLESKQIVFVKIASNYETYTAYIEQAINTFTNLGYSLVIIDIADLTTEEIKTHLENSNGLYLAGGNTFYLLQELKQKDLIEYLRQRIASGLFYIGESEGVIITSQNIKYTCLLDNLELAKELTDYDGLALVDFDLLPHDEEVAFIEATAAIKKSYQQLLNLLPINNHQAVIMAGKQYRIENEN